MTRPIIVLKPGGPRYFPRGVWGHAHLYHSIVHSFDVFDACLVRTAAVPDHRFLLLAEETLLRMGDDVSEEKVVELARLRVEAARAAWKASDRDDVPLEEIYRPIHLQSWGIAAAEMMKEELRLEAESVRPVARTGQSWSGFVERVSRSCSSPTPLRQRTSGGCWRAPA